MKIFYKHILNVFLFFEKEKQVLLIKYVSQSNLKFRKFNILIVWYYKFFVYLNFTWLISMQKTKKVFLKTYLTQ